MLYSDVSKWLLRTEDSFEGPNSIVVRTAVSWSYYRKASVRSHPAEVVLAKQAFIIACRRDIGIGRLCTDIRYITENACDNRTHHDQCVDAVRISFV